MKSCQLRQKRRNQSGQMVVDFMISITIALGLFILFFAMTYTFATVEVAQYVAFSAARAQAAGNVTVDAQRAAGAAKLSYLATKSPDISPMFNPAWFEFGANAEQKLGAASGGTFTTLAGPSNANFLQSFTGVSIPFVSHLLSIHVPFIMGSQNQDQGDDSGTFATHINAILVREPSMQECQDFWVKTRFGLLQGLPSGQFRGVSNSTYRSVEDNGC